MPCTDVSIPKSLAGVRTIESTTVPAVEGTALGHDAVVDLRGRVECQLYATAPEAAEEVADDMELEESVHDDRQEDESGDGVAVARHHRRRAKQQLAGRLADGDSQWHRETEKLRLQISDSGSSSQWGRIRCGRQPQSLSHPPRALLAAAARPGRGGMMRFERQFRGPACSTSHVLTERCKGHRMTKGRSSFGGKRQEHG
jgi:hypothetical protein